jgi:hypothetical protein
MSGYFFLMFILLFYLSTGARDGTQVHKHVKHRLQDWAIDGPLYFFFISLVKTYYL